MKKNLRTVLALVLSIMMVLSGISALADGTNNLSRDTALTISGLDEGDTVYFYRVLQFDQDATTTGGWAATDAFKYVAETQTTGLDAIKIQKILALDANGKPVDTTAADYSADNYGISASLAADLGDLAEKIADGSENYKVLPAQLTAPATGDTTTGYTATVSTPDDGLYIAIVIPGQAGTIYNPVFVGADYKQPATGTDPSSTFAIPLTNSYSPAAMVKKSTITLDKTASTSEQDYEDKQPETVAAGDTVTFTVVTKIPVYNNNYTSAVFNVVDTLSTGLELKTGTIKVFTGTGDTKTELAAANHYTIKNKAMTAAIAETDTDGYGIVFDTSYILGDGRVSPDGQDITITYDAEVTTNAPFSVNMEKNTVEVQYSNKPTDNTGAGRLKDETKHYTFDIDADILGETSGNWVTTEVVKVGLDKDGNEITSTSTTLHDGQTKVGALENAEFLLYTSSACNPGDVYTNSIMKTGYKIVSDATGRLNIYNLKEGKTDEWEAETLKGIRGLDVGTYYLKETQAPAGYIKAQDPVKVEIIAPKPTGTATSNDYWKLVTYTDEDDETITWDVWELLKYDVKINNVQTASYTFVNDEDEASTLGSDEDKPIEGDKVTGLDASGYIQNTDAADAASRAGKITNTQGVELPSTGGVGTTIFYVAGSLMVLAAAILLITKRRMGVED